MTIGFSKPAAKRDLITATTNSLFLIIRGVAAMSTGEYLNTAPVAYGHLNKVLNALKSENEAAPENLAWTWLAMTLTEATSQFAIRLRKETILKGDVKERAIEKYIEASLMLSTDAQFDQHIFFAPPEHPAFLAARNALPQLIHDITPWVQYDQKKWQNEFTECLIRASQYVISARNQILNPLVEAVSGPAGDAVRREVAWNLHTQWLHHRFTETCVFSPDGSVTTPLCDLYLRLRCFWHTKSASSVANSDELNTKWKAHLGQLHEEIEEWLSVTGADNIRVIAGGPGSGKSSFARAIASELAYQGKYRIIFIELQRLQMTGNLRADISTYLEARNNPTNIEGSAGFPENPLVWLKSDERPALFVFDGLDELTHDAELAKQKSSDFILQAKRLVADSREDGIELKAIILGRNLSCQDGLKAASLPIESMLNVAPIRPLKPEDITPNIDGYGRLRDEQLDLPEIDGIFSKDQRPNYWAKWAKSLGDPSKAMPEAVTHPALSDLNVEPLLLHLLILSDFCGTEWPKAAANRNLVYEDILTKVQKRNVTKQLTNKGLELQDFMLLMECLGLAAWRGNGRAGEEETFDRVRNAHARHRRAKLSEIGAEKMESILVHAHARRVDGERPGFEFIHKSFGEYLAARGLVSLALQTAKRMANLEDPIDEISAARNWIEIVDSGELSNEVVRFVRDEARRRIDAGVSKSVKTQLEALMSWVILNGFPYHGNAVENFRELDNKQQCAEITLLSLGTAVTRSLNEHIASKDDKLRLQFNIPSEQLQKFVNRNNLYSGKIGPFALYHDLDLTGIGIGLVSGFFFFDGDFSNSCLKEGGFIHMQAMGGNFKSANMRKASLGRSSFQHADLTDVDFREASLDGCQFFNTDFTASDLRGADIDNITVHTSDFENVVFGRNRARRADLRGAQGLTEAHLRGIFGVKSGYGKTLLPEGLNPPDFWIAEPDGNRDHDRSEEVFLEAYNAWVSTQEPVD